MRQVNHLFGETLELSTTLDDSGRIIGQEIVSSAPDALVTFKINPEAALTAQDLRRLADKLEGRELTNANFPGTVDDDLCERCQDFYCSGGPNGLCWDDPRYDDPEIPF